MTNLPDPTTPAPLLVDAILGNTFRLLWRKFPILFLIGILPWAVLIPALMIFDEGWFGFALGCVMWTYGAASLTVAAFHLHHERSPGIIAILRQGMTGLVPLTLCAIVTMIMINIAASFFLLPGLYLSAMWCMIVPTVVLERRGFRCFGRSADLTAKHRWPLIGWWLIFSIIAMVIYMVPLMVLAAVTDGQLNLILGEDQGPVFVLVTMTVLNMMGGAATAVTYARLLEIEQGDLAHGAIAVFD